MLVPNVPCGVERLLQSSLRIGLLRNVLFLMYRVELKAKLLPHLLRNNRLFLMYRVELKERRVMSCPSLASSVPNVPCGVESLWRPKPALAKRHCS